MTSSISAATPPTVLILGAGGRFGQAAVHAFAAAGWHVVAQARSPLPYRLPAAADALLCDALDTQCIIAAVAHADVVVHALNPDYTRWDRLLPPLTAAVIRIALATGGLLLVPGNVYNFGAELPPLLSEDTPFVANTEKAGLRIQMEQTFADAAAQGLRSVVIRAGDFIGSSGTWIDMAIAKSLKKHVVTHMGPDDLPHAWAYLPDLAQAFVRLAERRQQLRGFQALHYRGLSLTGRQLHNLIEQHSGRALKAKPLPWPVLRLLAVFSPLMRAVLEMRYLWQRPHQLTGERLERLTGPLPQTPADEVVRTALAAIPAR